jgi:hypothetical protein
MWIQLNHLKCLTISFCPLTVALLLCSCAAAPPRDYYFSPNGGDVDGDGTAARPYQSIEKANGLSLNPGDRVLFQGGQSFTGNLELDSQSAGSAQMPVVIGSYGDGRATIDAEQGAGISVHNAGGVTVRDLIVYGAGRGGNSGAGVMFSNDLPFASKLDDVRIENVDASGFGSDGILVCGRSSDGTRGGYRHVRIVGCTSHRNLRSGIFVTGWWQNGARDYANQDVYIGYCRASENSGDPDSPDENRSGSGIFVEASDGVLIEHCLADGNGRQCAGLRGGPVGIWCSVAKNAVIQCNQSTDNHTRGRYDGGGFCFDGGVSDSMLQYNLSTNNDGSGYGIYAFDGSPATRHDVIRGNVSTNDGRRNGYAGIHLWNGGGGIRDIEIDHNSITVSAAPFAQPRCIWFQTSAPDIRVHDNLFATIGQGVRCVDVAAAEASVQFHANQYRSTDGVSDVRWNNNTFTADSAWEAFVSK